MNQNKTLTDLQLNRCYSRELNAQEWTFGMTAILKSLMLNQTLSTFGFAGNRLGSRVSALLSSILESNSTLTDVDLSMNGFQDEDIFRICAGLYLNKSITSIDLSKNLTGQAIEKAIAHLLYRNTTLLQISYSVPLTSFHLPLSLSGQCLAILCQAVICVPGDFSY